METPLVNYPIVQCPQSRAYLGPQSRAQCFGSAVAGIIIWVRSRGRNYRKGPRSWASLFGSAVAGVIIWVRSHGQQAQVASQTNYVRGRGPCRPQSRAERSAVAGATGSAVPVVV